MEQAPKNGVVEGVRKWLRQGGYPLEYEAEQAFREAGFDVRRGFYYDDEDEQGRPKRREIDIVAVRQGMTPCPLLNGDPWQVRTTLGFFIESKHVERGVGREDTLGRPWVAFTSPHHTFPRPGGLVLPVASSLGRYAIYSLAENQQGLRLPMFQIPERAGYSLVSAHAPKNDPGPTYSALQAAIKAACSWIPTPAPTALAFPGELFIGFPVVVTDNDLVECWFAEHAREEKLDDQPAREEIEPREELRLYWHGSTLLPDYIAIDVITRPALQKYARRMFDGCETLIEQLQECVPLWAKEIMEAGLGEFNRRLEAMEAEWP